jgi:hypothetical protein
MLNGVGDQFVDDQAKRHRDIRADDERVGVDRQRPGSIGAARCRGDFPAKVDEILVKRDSSGVVTFVELFVQGASENDVIHDRSGKEIVRGALDNAGARWQRAQGERT